MKKKELLIIFVSAGLVTILCHFVPFCREIFTVCEPRAFGGCREHVELALPLWFLVLAVGWWAIKKLKIKNQKLKIRNKNETE